VNAPIGYAITLDAAIDMVDVAIVSWSRRLRAEGKAPTREAFFAIVSRASELDDAGDVDGLLKLVAELKEGMQ
jgi:hypothetical protein